MPQLLYSRGSRGKEMQAFLILLARWFLGALVARVLVGAGLAFVGVPWVREVIDEQLAAIQATMPLVADPLVSILGIAGFWVGLDWFASAIVAGTAVLVAKHALILAAAGTGIAVAGTGEEPQ